MIKSMNKDLFEKLCDEGLAYIYVIKLHDEVESFYKIGITSLILPLRKAMFKFML